MKILQGMPVGDAGSLIAAGAGNVMNHDAPLDFHVPTLAITMVEPGQYPPSARASATRFMKMTPVNLAGDTSGMALAHPLALRNTLDEWFALGMMEIS